MLARAAITINGAVGFRTRPATHLTIPTRRIPLQLTEGVAQTFGAGGRAGTRSEGSPDRIRLRPLPPEQCDPRPKVFFG
jgi:hypothetical protein